mgnify:CR=1 FL=1|jgi:glycosyltransferase involved in cell wall biosynthesis
MKKNKKKQLHIFWLHTHFLYWMGGTKFIYEVIKILSKKFRITIIVENTSIEAMDNYSKLDVQLLSLNKLTSTSLIYWLTLPIQIVWENIAILRLANSSLELGEKPIIVSNMFPMNVVGNYLAAKTQSRHIQYIFEPFAFFHDQDFISNFPIFKRFLIRSLSLTYKKMDIKATKKTTSTITLNQTTAKYIREIFGVNPAISYAGINTDHFKPFASSALKKKYKGKQVVVHSTDYSPVKGTDKMIKIFALVKKKVPSAHLIITSTIKNPKAEQKLRNLASELKLESSVEFLGFVDYHILPQLYSLAKVLVQCSYSERSGTTSMALPVKEALSCGTLAVRYPVKNEDVVDGVTGHLVDPRDTGKMVKAIVKVMKMDTNKYQQASRKARKSIVNKFSWKNTAESIQDLFYNK